MRVRRTLFRKYVFVFVTVIGSMLIFRGLIELYISYRDNRAAIVRLQKEKAATAALRIEHFIREIQGQIRWVSHPIFMAQEQAAEQRRLDFLWLLHQVPSVTEVSHLDATGKEQLRVSRLNVDEVGSQKDHSAEPKFLGAMTGNVYFGPVYFRNESEPYMTLSMKWQGPGAGVTAAELNLKLVWDVVSQVKAGEKGYAYVVDPRGILIAHHDISLVLQKTDLSRLPQVQAAISAVRGSGAEVLEAGIGRDQRGESVFTGSSSIDPLGWSVFVEQPASEAFSPLYDSILSTLALLALGLGLAVVTCLILARSMARPIQALQAGAARIGAGHCSDCRADAPNSWIWPEGAVPRPRFGAEQAIEAGNAEIEGLRERREGCRSRDDADIREEGLARGLRREDPCLGIDPQASVHDDASLGRRQDAAEDGQERRLSRARRPHQKGEFTGMQIEVDALQDGQVAGPGRDRDGRRRLPG